MKANLVEDGFPLVREGFFCEFNIENKWGKLFSSDGSLLIDNLFFPFIKNEEDFLNCFSALSSFFGMSGNGQRGKAYPENFEWFFKKKNKHGPYTLNDGDVFIFDKDYYGENKPAIYIRGGRISVIWKFNINIILSLLFTDYDIKNFVILIAKFYYRGTKQIILNENRLAWSFYKFKGG